MKLWRFLIFSIISLFCLVSPSIAIEGSGIHVILLMDASGSMKKTDPHSLRLDAGELFVRLLDKKDTLSVISFHSEAIKLAILKNPSSELKELVDSIRKIGSKGLYTDLYNALNTALDLSRTYKGKNIIILLSDGKMDTGDPVKDREKTELVKNNLLALSRSEGIPIYTISFSELSDMEFLREIAIKTGALNFMVKKASEIHQVFTKIFNEIKRPDSLPIINREFLIDSSIEDVNIIVTRGEENRDIVLEDPHGKSYTYKTHPAFMRWFHAATFDMIGIEKPVAGRWKIHYSADRGNEIFILTDLRLRISEIKNIYQPGDSMIVETWLEEKGQRLGRIPVLLRYIEFSGSLTTSEGLTEKIDFRDDGQQPDRTKEDGIYTSLITLNKKGDHLLTVTVKGKTFERKVEKIFTVKEKEHSEETISPKKEEKIMDRETSQKEPPSEPAKDNLNSADHNGISWKGVILKFVLINLVIGAIIAAFIFLKKKKASSQREEDNDED